MLDCWFHHYSLGSTYNLPASECIQHIPYCYF
ncbi:hypothetical protein [Plasmodium yoelii yoelii]|uniref:Uncharacterized protein n=1 Tax=Plasmodium yoelii yoelii TaxID=73239 RepID=Q7RA86_PLAYO|nr:hypothetical protein [Plasmodium yoelii yoelii]